MSTPIAGVEDTIEMLTRERDQYKELLREAVNLIDKSRTRLPEGYSVLEDLMWEFSLKPEIKAIMTGDITSKEGE